MRDIKFRVWSENNKRYIFPEDKEHDLSLRCIAIFDDGSFDILNGMDEVIFNRDDDGLNLEQYTGLRDRNGKEIYVGDIVQLDMNHYQIKATVVYREDLMAFVFEHPKGIEDIFQSLKDYVEVIGNIHDKVGLVWRNK